MTLPPMQDVVGSCRWDLIFDLHTTCVITAEVYYRKRNKTTFTKEKGTQRSPRELFQFLMRSLESDKLTMHNGKYVSL